MKLKLWCWLAVGGGLFGTSVVCSSAAEQVHLTCQGERKFMELKALNGPVKFAMTIDFGENEILYNGVVLTIYKLDDNAIEGYATYNVNYGKELVQIILNRITGEFSLNLNTTLDLEPGEWAMNFKYDTDDTLYEWLYNAVGNCAVSSQKF